jgi:membrane protease YdiL (CAAX protease family)
MSTYSNLIQREIQMSTGKIAVVTSPVKRLEIPIFIVIVGLIISAAMVLVSTTGVEDLALIGVLLVGPSVIAIVMTALILGRPGLRHLLIKQMKLKVGNRWSLGALLLIPAIAAITVSLRALFGGSDIASDIDYSISAILPEIAPLLFLTLLISLGEEFGWRGYLLPRLQVRLSALQASLVLGVLWGLWHFPGFLVGTGVPLDTPLS